MISPNLDPEIKTEKYDQRVGGRVKFISLTESDRIFFPVVNSFDAVDADNQSIDVLYWHGFDHENIRIALRVQRAVESLKTFVEVHPHKCGGVAVLKGTRFSIAQVIAQLAEGDSTDTLIEEFGLDPETLEMILRCISDILSKPCDHDVYSSFQ